MWTQFMDMHSGGGTKEKPYQYIYIEAPEQEAKVIFYNRFGHSAERVTCTCCGEDYSVSEDESLEQATAYERGCAFVYRRPDGTVCPREEGFVSGKGTTPGYTSGYEETVDTRFSFSKYLSIDEYRKKEDVLFIDAANIKDTERAGDVPEQGYVWR